MAITNTFATTWQQTARLAQLHREASLAKVDPPLPDVPVELPLNVTAIPQQLLSRDELRITETRLMYC